MNNIRVAIYLESSLGLEMLTNENVSISREIGDFPFNRDDQFYYMRVLYKKFMDANIMVDMYLNFIESNIYPTHSIFFDIPRKIDIVKNEIFSKSYKIAMLSECEVISPVNYDKQAHELFDCIFTQVNSLVYSNPKAMYLPTIRDKLFTDYDLKNFNKYHNANKSKLCVLISSNKTNPHPLELYSSRESLVEWFDCNFPDDFDLYGYDWDKAYFQHPSLLTFLNRFKIFTERKSIYKFYKGEVLSKIDTMSNYKFSISFENAKDIDGYLTEKIFDSMISGAVPIYYGDPNIEKRIPRECYIKFEDFNGYADLYDYIKNISQEEYNNYLKAISRFLRSEAIHIFSASASASILVNKIMNLERT